MDEARDFAGIDAAAPNFDDVVGDRDECAFFVARFILPPMDDRRAGQLLQQTKRAIDVPHVSVNYAAYCSIWAKKRTMSPTQIVGRIGSINAVYFESELEHAAFRADAKDRMASTTAADGGLNEATFQSTIPKVFFGGDSALGPKNIIWAVPHGHDAAVSIDQCCRRRKSASIWMEGGGLRARGCRDSGIGAHGVRTADRCGFG